MNRKVRVLVVDDSPTLRRLLSQIMDSDPDIEVVGTAGDPYIARSKIKKLDPDVLTLDVEMPRMDGLTFLANLMRLRPMPVVMVSRLTDRNADATLRALELGAVDFVVKPDVDIADTLDAFAAEINGKIKAAASVTPRALASVPAKRVEVDEKLSVDAVLGKKTRKKPFTRTETLLAIGASTGGTEAIKDVLAQLPANAPATVITQHIPAAFSAPFAERVNSVSAMSVCQAVDGQAILPGHAYIAPGDRHLQVICRGGRYYCALNDGPPVNRHKPAVDVLFRSVAQEAGPNAIGVLLTGMGDDGARGLKEMQEAGAHTIAQDERTSVVWGMPGAAVKLGAADMVLGLDKIAGYLMTQLQALRKHGT